MIATLGSLFVKLAFFRVLLTLLGSVLVVLPVGLLLIKFLAIPLLAVLAIVGLPLLFVVALLGFPFFIVFAIGGVALALLAAVVTFGFVALKIFLFVVLPIWILLRVMRWAALATRKLEELDAAAARIARMRQVLRTALACGCMDLKECAPLLRLERGG